MGARRLNGKLNILSKNIAKYRALNNLSQTDVCRELALIGITMYICDIYEIEHCIRTIKDYEVLGFSKIFNISLEQLYEGTEKELNI